MREPVPRMATESVLLHQYIEVKLNRRDHVQYAKFSLAFLFRNLGEPLIPWLSRLLYIWGPVTTHKNLGKQSSLSARADINAKATSFIPIVSLSRKYPIIMRCLYF